jgi:hypothetical protein
MNTRTRLPAVQLLRCAADMVIVGEPFPVLEAERGLGIGRTDNARVAALQARDANGGDRTELQLLEAAALLEDGWSPGEQMRGRFWK